GNCCFSTTSTRKFSRCNSAAALEPAGPAPMISTSVSVGIGWGWRTQALSLRFFRLQQRRHALDIFDERPITFERWRDGAHQIVELSVIAAHDIFLPAQVGGLGQSQRLDGDDLPE